MIHSALSPISFPSSFRVQTPFLGFQGENFKVPTLHYLEQVTFTTHLISPSPIQMGVRLCLSEVKSPSTSVPNQKDTSEGASEIRFLNHVFFPPHLYDLTESSYKVDVIPICEQKQSYESWLRE